MSTCISRYGEYSSHVPDDDFVCTRCAVLDGAAVIADHRRLLAEIDRLHTERTEFIDALGFDGPNDTTPLTFIQDPLAMAMADASDHQKCPVVCEGGCGETLASTVCPRCNGGGSTSTSGYEECGDCGGDRFVHEGCVGKTYAELVAEVNRLRAERNGARNMAMDFDEANTGLSDGLIKARAETERARTTAVTLEQELAHERSVSRRLASEGTVIATALQRVRDAIKPGPRPRDFHALACDVREAMAGEVPDGT